MTGLRGLRGERELELDKERERERERGRERERPCWADVSLRQDGADGGEAPETGKLCGNNDRQHLVRSV